MRKFKKAAGFSMIELIIVIVILAIISIPVYVNWDESITMLDQQTEILVNHLRYTQNLSMSKNNKCRLVITSANTYRIRNNKGVNLSIPNVGKINPAQLDNEISFVLPPTGFTNAIIFNGRGVPFTDTPSVSKLMSNAQIILQHRSGRIRTITIAPETGKISSS